MDNCLEKVYNPFEVSVAKRAIPAWKRPLDITCILLAAPLWVPCMAVIAATIKITSPGPVFFRQERIGFKGQTFTCLKFRSMRVNASSAEHEKHLKQLLQSGAPMAKMDGMADKRLIGIGRLLRATGLDELPQIFNVLAGEMGLVGPRPCIAYEAEQFSSAEKLRQECLPGLTGLWQVSGKNKTTFQEMIKLDTEYLEKMSLRRDVAIMCKTLPTVLSQVSEVLKTKKNRNK